jgi:hypothetical protein
MTTGGPEHPGGLFRLVGTPERHASRVVSHTGVSADGRQVDAVVYSAFALRVRLTDDGAEATLLTPEPVEVPAAAGEWREAAAAVTENALQRAASLLPAGYLHWYARRGAMATEARIHEAPDVTALDEVLALLQERFGEVMSEPVVASGADGEGDARIDVRLYGTFDLATGLERPRGNFFRSLPLPGGWYVHNLPGEGRLGTPPASIRRAYRVLDEYCRARLDLPARTDDEETP